MIFVPYYRLYKGKSRKESDLNSMRYHQRKSINKHVKQLGGILDEYAYEDYNVQRKRCERPELHNAIRRCLQIGAKLIYVDLGPRYDDEANRSIIYRANIDIERAPCIPGCTSRPSNQWSTKSRAKSLEARRDASAQFFESAVVVIGKLLDEQSDGRPSLRTIAAHLNETGFATRRGTIGNWDAHKVRQVVLYGVRLNVGACASLTGRRPRKAARIPTLKRTP
jgi:hypothetical protein